MPGPWDKYQKPAEAKAAAPPPWELYKITSEKPKPPDTSVGESAIRGVAQGATFGFADEASARVNAAVDYISAKMGKRGDISWHDAVETNLNAIRGADKKAEEDNPGTFRTGMVAGGVAGGVGLGAAAKGAGLMGKVAGKANTLLNPVAGGGIRNAIRAGATSGALAGAGASESSPLQQGFYEDVGMGAAMGGVAGGALKGAGKLIKGVTPTNIAKKGANVFLGTPEEVTDVYIKNPAGVKTALKRFELAKSYDDVLDSLKKEVVEGSAESRAILAKEGAKIPASKIAELAKTRADEIASRGEGIMDDPQIKAAYSWLRRVESDYSPEVIPGKTSGLLDASGKAISTPSRTIDKSLTTNRVKDTIQGIDRQTQFEVSPGNFSRIDDTVQKGLRSDVDSLLKSTSPTYAKQMATQVAPDAALLSEAEAIRSSPQAMANIFRRLETDQYGSGQIPRDVIARLDQRMKSNLLKMSELTYAREAFDKSAANGSRSVNLFSNMLKDIPVLKHLAPVIGGSVDKYGREMTMKAVDVAVKLNGVYQKEGAQALSQAIAPIMQAAKAGNAPAQTVLQLMFGEGSGNQSQKRSAIDRRLQGGN